MSTNLGSFKSILAPKADFPLTQAVHGILSLPYGVAYEAVVKSSLESSFSNLAASKSRSCYCRCKCCAGCTAALLLLLLCGKYFPGLTSYSMGQLTTYVPSGSLTSELHSHGSMDKVRPP